MQDRSKLLRLVREAEALLDRSWGMADQDFLSRRKEALDLRREITRQTAEIGALGEAAFQIADDKQQFRRHFSAARSAMSLHHASWPIVLIDLEDPEYRRSSETFRKTYAAFIVWVKVAVQ